MKCRSYQCGVFTIGVAPDGFAVLQCDGWSRQSSDEEDGSEGHRLQMMMIRKRFSDGQERKGVKFSAVGSLFGRVSYFMISLDPGSGFQRQNCGEGSLGVTTA